MSFIRGKVRLDSGDWKARCVEGSETRLERWSAIYLVLACMAFGIDSVFGQRFAHVLIQINHDLAVFVSRAVQHKLRARLWCCQISYSHGQSDPCSLLTRL